MPEGSSCLPFTFHNRFPRREGVYATQPPGGGRMAQYRLYFLGGDGRISLADWIEVASDEDAIAAARQL